MYSTQYLKCQHPLPCAKAFPTGPRTADVSQVHGPARAFTIQVNISLPLVLVYFRPPMQSRTIELRMQPTLCEPEPSRSEAKELSAKICTATSAELLVPVRDGHDSIVPLAIRRIGWI